MTEYSSTPNAAAPNAPGRSPSSAPATWAAGSPRSWPSAGPALHSPMCPRKWRRSNYDRLLAESDQFIADGLFPAGSTEILKQNLWAAKDIEEAVADADFIEEAVPEVIAIKHQTLARISAAARPDAIIGSNTSTISIADLSEAVTNPERFLGVHFSNPSPFIPGVEIIPHAGTSAATVGARRASWSTPPASRPPSSRTSPASC